MFMTPMPPTSSDSAAMPVNSTVRVLLTEVAVFSSDSWLLMVKSADVATRDVVQLQQQGRGFLVGGRQLVGRCRLDVDGRDRILGGAADQPIGFRRDRHDRLVVEIGRRVRAGRGQHTDDGEFDVVGREGLADGVGACRTTRWLSTTRARRPPPAPALSASVMNRPLDNVRDRTGNQDGVVPTTDVVQLVEPLVSDSEVVLTPATAPMSGAATFEARAAASSVVSVDADPKPPRIRWSRSSCRARRSTGCCRAS